MADDNDRLIPGGPSALGVRSKPTSPASEAVVLYDSRQWDGTTIGVGTGGLPQQGTSSLPDLDVIVSQSGGRVTTNAINGVGGQALGLNWDDIGGYPCDQPITVYLAFNEMSPVQHGAVADFGITLRETQFSTDLTLVSSFMSTFDQDDVTGSSAMRLVTNAGDTPQIFYRPGINPGQGANLRNKLHVYTMDPIDGGGSCWRIGPTHPSTPDPLTPLYETFGSSSQEYYSVIDTGYPNDAFGFPGGCTSAPADISTYWWFIRFGDDRRIVDSTAAPLYGAPVAGERWNGLFGVAVCRGEPTPADLAYWDDYFYGVGYTPWVNPIKYEGGDYTGDGTYVFHDFDFPGTNFLDVGWNSTPPATIDILMVGGGAGGGGNGDHEGGGGAEFDVVTGVTAPVSQISFTVGAAGIGGTNSVAATDGGATTILGNTVQGGQAGTGGTGGTSGSGNAGGAGDGTRGGGGGGDGGVGGVPSSLPAPDGRVAQGGAGTTPPAGWPTIIWGGGDFGVGGHGGGPAGALEPLGGGTAWPNDGASGKGEGGAGAKTDLNAQGADGGGGRVTIRYLQ